MQTFRVSNDRPINRLIHLSIERGDGCKEVGEKQVDRQTERQTTSTAVENNQTQGNADLDVTWLPVVLIRDRIFAAPVEDWLQVLDR